MKSDLFEIKQFDMEDVNGDNIVEVLIVSDKYGCLKMKDQVEKRMISSELTHENVSGLLVISDRHNANKLKQMCCEYIRRHYSQVIQTSQYREIQSEVKNILNEKKNTSAQSNTTTAPTISAITTNQTQQQEQKLPEKPKEKVRGYTFSSKPQTREFVRRLSFNKR
jgi:altronate dehydratase